VKAVKVSGLVKQFGGVAAVKDVSFEVEAGKFVTLLGPSGCGKTTTLRMIAGLERPDAGSITVADRVLTSVEQGITTPPEKRGMGMVFQSYAIWPHMTVFQNVAFPLEEKHIPGSEIRERVLSILETVGLGGLHDRPAPLLSGGQQQRVALARALVSNPDVLLLDEPLSNLDARLREEMRFELREMQSRLGITSIFVTHDQVEAMTLSDHMIVMLGGRIEQQGHPREVYNQPSSQFVMDFLGQVNHLPARVVSTPDEGFAAVVQNGEAGFRVSLPSGGAWADGESVTLAFRSEDVLLSASNDPRNWAGRVISAIYMGSHTEYTVELGGTRIRVLGPPDDELQAGTRIQVHIAAGRVRAFTGDSRTERARARANAA
jgi:iron(III) transport system ATP-binding protein